MRLTILAAKIDGMVDGNLAPPYPADRQLPRINVVPAPSTSSPLHHHHPLIHTMSHHNDLPAFRGEATHSPALFTTLDYCPPPSPPTSLGTGPETGLLSTDAEDSTFGCQSPDDVTDAEDAPSDSGYMGTDETDSLFDRDHVPEETPDQRLQSFPLPSPVSPSLEARAIPAHDGKCWLCDAPSTHIAHVTAKPDHAIVPPPLPTTTPTNAR